MDIDEIELLRKVHADEISYVCDVNEALDYFLDAEYESVDRSEWLKVCEYCKIKTEEYNDTCPERMPNAIIKAIGDNMSEDTVFAIDVGQHMMWSAQSLPVVGNRRILFSGGHGAMGFALPAAIGACFADAGKPVCIAGDGAFQMNIQELQWVVREQIPVTIFVLNNNVLGLIRQQQDDFFGSRYYGSSKEGGFESPDFAAIAKAYGIDSYKVNNVEELVAIKEEINAMKPVFVEVMLPVDTKAYPKTYFGQEMYSQKPYIPDELMEEILSM